jgi:TetR/AcrR family transcriptional repressor of nem operon
MSINLSGYSATHPGFLLAHRMTCVILKPLRYSPDHKQLTRLRIVEAASQAFRERGVAETGLDEVMRRAGLTHGGFYAHFRDKTELVAEACAAGFAEAVPNLGRIAALSTPAARVRLLIDSYLSERHRKNRGSGCLIVAVAADMARLDGPARRGYSQAFTRHLERLGSALQLSRDPETNLDCVTQLMSSLVGALLFARAIDDPQQSQQILHSMRRMLRAQFSSASFTESLEPSTARTGRPDSSSHDLLRPI